MDLKKKIKEVLDNHPELIVDDIYAGVNRKRLFEDDTLSELELILKFLKNLKSSDSGCFLRVGCVRQMCDDWIRFTYGVSRVDWFVHLTVFLVALMMCEFRFEGYRWEGYKGKIYVKFRDVERMLKDGGINVDVRISLREFLNGMKFDDIRRIGCCGFTRSFWGGMIDR